MIETFAQYDAMLKTKKIAMIGLGVSHRQLAEEYAAMGANLTVLDRRSKEEMGEDYTRFSALGVSFINGPDYLEHLESFDVVLRSPGVKYLLPQIQAAIQKGVFVTGELELFFALCPCPIFGVTGSDGKTTTTLISKMLEAAGKRVFLGGNIGAPLLPRIRQITKNDVAVVELSSFQLMSMPKSPQTALITNLAPNHLDWHTDMQEYCDAKRNIFLHQGADGRLVCNISNPITCQMLKEAKGQALGFSRLQRPQKGCFLTDEGNLAYADGESVTPLFHLSAIRLRGEFNLENYLAACTAVYGFVTPAQMEQVAKTFGGVEHRNEHVCTIHGVEWINDSIASSPTRTIAGLSLYDQKILLIAGGYDKKIPYAPLVEPVLQKVKQLILMGDTAPKIQEAVTAHPNFAQSGLQIHRVENMQQAVDLAEQLAVAGDIVSLSPASASFGLYQNFEKRGEHFKALVLDKQAKQPAS